MGPVDCVLLNPAVDHVVEVDGFHAGGTFMSQASWTFPAGKALSVAVGLKALGIEPRMLAVVGKGEESLYDAWLSRAGIDHVLFPVEGATRRHVTVVDRATGTSTHLREHGFHLDPAVAGELVDSVDAGVAVVSGSFPPGIDSEVAGALVERLRSRGTGAFVDTSGSHLATILDGGAAHAIKVNVAEFNEATGGCGEVAPRLPGLLRGMTSTVAVTLGAAGAFIATGDGVVSATVEVLPSAPLCGGTVGAGDAFMAGLVDGILRDHDLERLARDAVATATASLFIPGPGALDPVIRDAILPRVTVRRVT